ncbi:Cilia- and flagella-associated protein 70 [Cichlidogyrus casuarinus]|uniref:Cilia- and flagella-associated protein 70 n=1 Tax=Cichlidogyrus casuarinus TaxID=1844966 RepID=A0ABD2Q9K0_9PLAT
MAKKPVLVHFELESIVGHTLGTEQAKFSARLEFRSKTLGETAKIDAVGETELQFNHQFTLNMEGNDNQLLDDCVNRPFIVSLLEHNAKDKKQKDMRPQTIYNATFDIVHLLIFPHNTQEMTLKMCPPVGSPYEKVDFEVSPIILKMSVCVPQTIKDQLELALGNVVRFTVESLFSPPESLVNSAGTGQLAVCLPFSNEVGTESVLNFVNGAIRFPVDKENNLKKWSTDLSSIQSNSSFIANRFVPSYKDLSCEEGDFKTEEFLDHRITSLNAKPRILWNIERRSFLPLASLQYLKSHIAKDPILPFEIYKLNLPVNAKTKKEDECLYNFHGVAYVDCTPLLYPGVKKLRGAFEVHPFMQNEYQSRASLFIQSYSNKIDWTSVQCAGRVDSLCGKYPGSWGNFSVRGRQCSSR